jgi:predicted N-acetyltransferase YhbS
MRQPSMSVRPAGPTDSRAIAALLSELGYPTMPEELPGRLQRLQLENQAAALVAVDGSEVVGLVTVHRFSPLHTPAQVALLTALVVAESARRRGAGRLLVAAAEDHARASGCGRIMVTTAEHRAGAHAFYARMGWEYTGRRFAKHLTVSPGAS